MRSDYPTIQLYELIKAAPTQGGPLIIAALQKKALRSLSPKDKLLHSSPLEGMFHTFNYPSTFLDPSGNQLQKCRRIPLSPI